MSTYQQGFCLGDLPLASLIVHIAQLLPFSCGFPGALYSCWLLIIAKDIVTRFLIHRFFFLSILTPTTVHTYSSTVSYFSLYFFGSACIFWGLAFFIYHLFHLWHFECQNHKKKCYLWWGPLFETLLSDFIPAIIHYHHFRLCSWFGMNNSNPLSIYTHVLRSAWRTIVVTSATWSQCMGTGAPGPDGQPALLCVESE